MLRFVGSFFCPSTGLWPDSNRGGLNCYAFLACLEEIGCEGNQTELVHQVKVFHHCQHGGHSSVFSVKYRAALTSSKCLIMEMVQLFVLPSWMPTIAPLYPFCYRLSIRLLSTVFLSARARVDGIYLELDLHANYYYEL